MKKQCCINTIKEIEEWLKERTFNKKGFPQLVRFMSFEWVELKNKIIGEN